MRCWTHSAQSRPGPCDRRARRGIPAPPPRSGHPCEARRGRSCGSRSSSPAPWRWARSTFSEIPRCRWNASSRVARAPRQFLSCSTNTSAYDRSFPERRIHGDVVGERGARGTAAPPRRRALAEIDGEVRRGGGASPIADDEQLRVAVAHVTDRVDDAGHLLVRQRAERGVQLGEVAADELEGHGRGAGSRERRGTKDTHAPGERNGATSR